MILQFERAANIDLWSGRLVDGEIMPHGDPHAHRSPGRKFVDWLF